MGSKIILYINKHVIFIKMITISKPEFEKMKQEIEILRNSSLYKRLLESEKNISMGKIYTRKDLRF